MDTWWCQVVVDRKIVKLSDNDECVMICTVSAAPTMSNKGRLWPVSVTRDDPTIFEVKRIASQRILARPVLNAAHKACHMDFAPFCLYNIVDQFIK